MNEDFERKFERAMEFHLRQQAEFDVNMAQLEAAQAETQKKLDQTIEIMSSLTAVTFEGFKVLSETQKRTEEELQKLLGRVNRHLSDDHGLEN